jgi:hypothetical protein
MHIVSVALKAQKKIFNIYFLRNYTFLCKLSDVMCTLFLQIMNYILIEILKLYDVALIIEIDLCI